MKRVEHLFNYHSTPLYNTRKFPQPWVAESWCPQCKLLFSLSLQYPARFKTVLADLARSGNEFHLLATMKDQKFCLISSLPLVYL